MQLQTVGIGEIRFLPGNLRINTDDVQEIVHDSFELTKRLSTALRMVVMPRTELNRVTLSRFNRAVIEQLPDRIVARTIEVLPESGVAVDVLYEFSPGLKLRSTSRPRASAVTN